MPLSKEQQREYQRKWLANRRAAFFADKTCIRCGSVDELELDHIDPAEKISHRIWSWSQERRDAETAKCQILCRECHDDKTAEDMNWGGHGTYTSYCVKKCRCDECRGWNAAQRRKERAAAKLREEKK